MLNPDVQDGTLIKELQRKKNSLMCSSAASVSLQAWRSKETIPDLGVDLGCLFAMIYEPA